MFISYFTKAQGTNTCAFTTEAKPIHSALNEAGGAGEKQLTDKPTESTATAVFNLPKEAL